MCLKDDKFLFELMETLSVELIYERNVRLMSFDVTSTQQSTSVQPSGWSTNIKIVSWNEIATCYSLQDVNRLC